MAYNMGGNLQLCGTCEFWIGTRQPDFFGSLVVLPDQSTEGKCWCLNGPHARGDRRSNSSVCSCYRKWLVLK